MSKKEKREDKKREEKVKINYEEMIWNNLSNPRLTLDKSGYTFVELSLKVFQFPVQFFLVFA